MFSWSLNTVDRYPNFGQGSKEAKIAIKSLTNRVVCCISQLA